MMEISDRLRKACAFYAGKAIVDAYRLPPQEVGLPAEDIQRLALDAVDLVLRGLDESGYDLTARG